MYSSSTPFKLNNKIAPNHAMSEEDILSLKKALSASGHYVAPPTGLTGKSDALMFDGMKRFQKRAGLAVDGVASPDGPTVKALNVAFTGPGRSKAAQSTDTRPPIPQRQRQQPSGESLPRPFAPSSAESSGKGTISVREYLADLMRRETYWKPNPQRDVYRDGIASLFKLAYPGPATPGFGHRNRPDDAVLSLEQIQKAALSAMSIFQQSDQINRFEYDELKTAPNQKVAGTGEQRFNQPKTPIIQSADQRVEQNDKQQETHNPKMAQPPVLFRWQDRKKSIVENTPSRIVVNENPQADGSEPWYELSYFNEVPEYDALIDRKATEYGVDPNLIKAIVYMETTHGFYDRILEPFGGNDSLRPMNIRSSYWKDLGYNRADLEDPERNIEAGVILLKRIQDRMPGADVEKIATSYQNLAADQVTDYGARVKEIYRQKLWEK